MASLAISTTACERLRTWCGARSAVRRLGILLPGSLGIQSVQDAFRNLLVHLDRTKLRLCFLCLLKVPIRGLRIRQRDCGGRRRSTASDHCCVGPRNVVKNRLPAIAHATHGKTGPAPHDRKSTPPSGCKPLHSSTSGIPYVRCLASIRCATAPEKNRPSE